MRISVFQRISTVLVAVGIMINGYMAREQPTVNDSNVIDLKSQIQNRMGRLIDFEKLLREFALISPLKPTCNTNNVRGFGTACMCGPNCVKSQLCCPNVIYGYLDYGCVNVAMYPSNKSITHYMIDKCPSHFDGTVRVKCEKEEDAITPVTSTDTQLKYKNRYCAICHGEENVQPWEITVKCLKENEFGNYENYRDFRRAIEENSCVVFYEMSSLATVKNGFEYSLESLHKSNLINKCNVTGLWDKYDPDVDWACQHLQFTYRNDFKNVFCYICNPSVGSRLSEIFIDTCNVTGEWHAKDYDEEISQACSQQGTTERLSPFKNVYCMMCNGFTWNTARFILENKRVDIEENITYHLNVTTSELYINIEFTGTNKKLIKKMKKLFKRVYGATSPKRTVSVKNTLEGGSFVKQQIDEYKSVCGQIPICNVNPNTIKLKNNTISLNVGTILTEPIQNRICQRDRCSCLPTCAERDNCCPEVLLEKRPYSCFKDNIFLKSNTAKRYSHENAEQDPGYLVIDNCISNRNDWVADMCTSKTKNNSLGILYDIPVRNSVPFAYKNVFCMLCNNNKPKKTIVRIHLQCNTFVEFPLFQDIKDLLNKTKTFCDVSFKPIDSKQCRREYNVALAQENVDRKEFYRQELQINETNPLQRPILSNQMEENIKQFFSKCNQTKVWSREQEAITFLCESNSENVLALPEYVINNKVFKNFACFICNPEIDVNMFDVNSSIASCNETGEFKMQTDLQHVMELCEKGDVYPRWLPFRNVYCSECNLRTWEGHISVQSSANEHPHMRMEIGTSFKAPSYRALFSLSPTDWKRIDDEDDGEVLPDCNNGTYDRSLKECRSLFCRSGRILFDGSCRPLLESSSETYSLSLVLERLNSTKQSTTLPMSPLSRNSEFYSQKDNVTLNLVCARVFDAIKTHFDNRTVYTHTCDATVDTPCIGYSQYSTQPVVDVSDVTHIVLTFEIKILSTKNLSNVEHVLVNSTSQNYTIKSFSGRLFSFKAKFHNANEPSDLYFPMSSGSCTFTRRLMLVQAGFAEAKLAVIDRFFTCPQIQLDADDFYYNAEADTVLVKPNNVTFTSEFFTTVDNDSIRICEKDFVLKTSKIQKHEADVAMNSLQKAYNIFSNVCTILSLMCLMLTFITYSIFHSMRTMPGKNNMSLVFSLFVAQTLLKFGLWLTKDDYKCVVMGCFIHYFWMTTFCAMNICCFHMFKVFYTQELSLPNSQQSLRLNIKYLCFTYLTPLFIVCATVGVNLFVSQGAFSGYGQYACFLSNTLSIAIAFISPATLIFITNIILFSIAFHKIRTSPRVQSSADRRDFFLYVKLCTLVGITWPLQIVDAIFELSPFSFIVVGVNALQGVFIFVSYTCNRRVLKMYQKKLCKPSDEKAFSSTDSKSKTNSTQMSSIRPKR